MAKVTPWKLLPYSTRYIGIAARIAGERERALDAARLPDIRGASLTVSCPWTRSTLIFPRDRDTTYCQIRDCSLDLDFMRVLHALGCRDN